jgi:hypothetical protein
MGHMKSWAIYRYESKGRMQYLGVISAKDREEALAKAIRLLPEEHPETLCTRPWEGGRTKEIGQGKAADWQTCAASRYRTAHIPCFAESCDE